MPEVPGSILGGEVHSSTFGRKKISMVVKKFLSVAKMASKWKRAAACKRNT